MTAPTFATLLFTVILMFPTTIILNAIFAYGEQKIMLYTLAIGGIGNVLFDCLLIPHFGILGSAMATVLSQGMAYGWAWMRMKRINNFYTLRHLKTAVVANLGMAIFTLIFYLSGINVIINIALSAAIYGALLFLLKEKHFMEVSSPALRKINLIK